MPACVCYSQGMELEVRRPGGHARQPGSAVGQCKPKTPPDPQTPQRRPAAEPDQVQSLLEDCLARHRTTSRPGPAALAGQWGSALLGAALVLGSLWLLARAGAAADGDRGCRRWGAEGPPTPPDDE